MRQHAAGEGPVERANKTLQDRLVKELRLHRISAIAAGNELLPAFLADYNARFGKQPRNSKNLHRPLSAGDDLTDVFAWREERTVSNSLTLQYDKVVFLLEPNAITRDLRRKRVTVVDCKGRGAHCVSRAPRRQSGEGIWLKAALYLTSRTDPRSRDGPDRSESIVCPLIAPARRHLALNPAGLDGRRCQGARPQRPRARSS